MKTLKRLKTFLRWKKPANPVEDFLGVLSAVENLEREGKLLVCSEADKPGIVLGYELAQYFQMYYVYRMQHYAELYGLENFLKARHTLRKFGRKNNPDEELLTLCQNARVIIDYRRAAAGAEHVERTAGPLYITFMDESLSKATHVGYELNGEITIEPVTQT